MPLLVTLVLGLALHLMLGWEFTLLAGVVGGYLAGPGGWWKGAIGVGLGWLIPVLYSFGVAGAETNRMADTLGGLLGGLPGALIVALTLGLGLLLGLLGGLIGTRVAFLVSGPRRRTFRRRTFRRR